VSARGACAACGFPRTFRAGLCRSCYRASARRPRAEPSRPTAGVFGPSGAGRCLACSRLAGWRRRGVCRTCHRKGVEPRATAGALQRWLWWWAVEARQVLCEGVPARRLPTFRASVDAAEARAAERAARVAKGLPAVPSAAERRQSAARGREPLGDARSTRRAALTASAPLARSLAMFAARGPLRLALTRLATRLGG
jgi:hypothetical protein